MHRLNGLHQGLLLVAGRPQNFFNLRVHDKRGLNLRDLGVDLLLNLADEVLLEGRRGVHAVDRLEEGHLGHSFYTYLLYGSLN